MHAKVQADQTSVRLGKILLGMIQTSDNMFSFKWIPISLTLKRIIIILKFTKRTARIVKWDDDESHFTWRIITWAHTCSSLSGSSRYRFGHLIWILEHPWFNVNMAMMHVDRHSCTLHSSWQYDTPINMKMAPLIIPNARFSVVNYQLKAIANRKGKERGERKEKAPQELLLEQNTERCKSRY